jgi:hypothetical protein
MAYVTGPQLKGYKSFNVHEISNNEPINKYSEDNSVSIIAIKRSFANSSGLDTIDFPNLIETDRLVPVDIAQPGLFYQQERPGMPYFEEIVYAITALNNGRIFLQPAKKVIKYNDGREVAKEYIPDPAVRNYNRIAVASTISSSSYLKDDSFYDRYNPVRAFDGVSETGWSEDVAGPGINESVTVIFQEPVTVDKIGFRPGWFQSQYFMKNNRIKTMEIILDDFRSTAHFSDSMTEQDISFNKNVTFQKAQFIIKEVYQTTQWDDTPLAEIDFYYNNEPILIDCTNIKINVSQL